MDHPGDDAFADLRALPEAQARTFEHLFRCRRCRALVARIIAAGDEKEPSPPRDRLPPPTRLASAVLRRLGTAGAQRAEELARDRERAPLLFDELVAAPEGGWATLARSEERFRSPAVVSLLLATSSEALEVEPQRAERLSAAALALAEQLDTRRFGAALAAELQVRALGQLGMTHRLRGDLAAAEEALRQAMARLDLESLAAPLRGSLCRALAALRADQGRIDEALGLLDRSASLHAAAGELEELGLTLAQEGLLRLAEDDADSALPPLLEAAGHLGRTREGVTVRVRLALAECYAALGRCDDAARTLHSSRQLYNLFPQRIEPWELQHVEARIEARCGHLDRALLRFRKVFAHLARRRDYDALLVALDWAEILLTHDRQVEIGRLKPRMTALLAAPPFHSRVRGVAGAAFPLLLRLDTVSALDLSRRLRRFLERARHHRDEEFPPGELHRPDLAWNAMGPDRRCDLCSVAELPLEVAEKPGGEIDLEIRERLSLCCAETSHSRLVFDQDQESPNCGQGYADPPPS
ncbi:MAG TPA: hypothetical protein VHQ90_10455 [Thermoanaerobaculia bacterium]|nr:hypothetical protein [Thermoanaerobaculia bacterium]